MLSQHTCNKKGPKLARAWQFKVCQFSVPQLGILSTPSSITWSQTQSCASSHSLTLNTGISINLELDETLSASQSKFMEQSIRDSRLWLNHSWLRVNIFEHNVVEKTNNKLSNIVVVCVSLNSIHLSLYCPTAFRPISEKMYRSMCMSLTELSSVSIAQSNSIICPGAGLLPLELLWLFSIY